MFDAWLSAVREFLSSLSEQQAKERRADEERQEWNAHFIGITARRMIAAPEIDLGVSDAGNLADGTLISLDPEPLLMRLVSSVNYLSRSATTRIPVAHPSSSTTSNNVINVRSGAAPEGADD